MTGLVGRDIYVFHTILSLVAREHGEGGTSVHFYITFVLLFNVSTVYTLQYEYASPSLSNSVEVH